MPKWVLPALVLLASLSLVPVACIARARAVHSPKPRLHLVPDMDNQGKYKAQQLNPWFADTRAMREPVEGTVARGQLRADDHYERGLMDGDYATTFPMTIDEELLDRGEQRFDIYCAPCHGLSGYGDGIVARRAERLQQGTWVPPASLHAEPAFSRPVGHLFNTITNGIRTMPAYGSQIPVEDRWAIVGYVRALQRSQHANLNDVPPDERQSLR
jgi:mono/diheme cytochrome c family protein